MLTGIAAVIVGYLGVEGITFAITKLFDKPKGGLATETHMPIENTNLHWALEKIEKNVLSKKDKEKYDKLVDLF